MAPEEFDTQHKSAVGVKLHQMLAESATIQVRTYNSVDLLAVY